MIGVLAAASAAAASLAAASLAAASTFAAASFAFALAAAASSLSTGGGGAAYPSCPPPASRLASARAVARTAGARPKRKRLWTVVMGTYLQRWIEEPKFVASPIQDVSLPCPHCVV